MSLALASLIGTAVKIGADVVKGNIQDKHQKKMEEYNERLRKRNDYQGRRAATGAMLGALQRVPQPTEQAPEAPNMTAINIIGGLGQIGASLATTKMAFRNPATGEVVNAPDLRPEVISPRPMQMPTPKVPGVDAGPSFYNMKPLG